jgi:hypothetical protein
MADFYIPESTTAGVSLSNCRSGNCSFAEPYHSLAICSSCTDPSLQISGRCLLGQSSICNYSLPVGLSMVAETVESAFLVAEGEMGEYPPPPAPLIVTRRFIWVSGVNGSWGYPFLPGGDPDSLPDVPASCQGTECIAGVAAVLSGCQATLDGCSVGAGGQK